MGLQHLEMQSHEYFSSATDNRDGRTNAPQTEEYLSAYWVSRPCAKDEYCYQTATLQMRS